MVRLVALWYSENESQGKGSIEMSKSTIYIHIYDGDSEIDVKVDTTNVKDSDKRLEIEKAAGDLAIKIHDILES